MKRMKSFSFTSKNVNTPLRVRNESNSSEGCCSSSSRSRVGNYETSEQGGSSDCNFRYGAVAMQGFRPHMQDNYSCSPSEKLKEEPFGFFAVFDGHGQYGEVVSQYCADNFMNCLVDRKKLRNAKTISPGDFVPALRKTFVKFDTQLKEAVSSYKPPQQQNRGGESSSSTSMDFLYSGTTSTIALVLKDSIIVGNVGDSRTILCRSGSVYFASTDHNPGDKVEDDRIIAAGGKVHTTPSKHKVIFDSEAYTNLAVSRTLGDFGFKKNSKIPTEDQIVCPVPDVTEIARDHRTDQFLLLCSDGVFKSMSSKDAVDFVLRQLQITEDLTKICRNLIEMAYYSPNCIPDDTTVVLVVLPAAPGISQKVIREEEAIEAECLEAINAEIKKIVSSAEAEWVLKNEFNIIQKVVSILPQKYCTQLRTKFIIKTLSEAQEERFAAKDSQESEVNSTDTKSAGDNSDGDDPNVYIPGKITTEPDQQRNGSVVNTSLDEVVVVKKEEMDAVGLNTSELNKQAENTEIAEKEIVIL